MPLASTLVKHTLRSWLAPNWTQDTACPASRRPGLASSPGRAVNVEDVAPRARGAGNTAPEQIMARLLPKTEVAAQSAFRPQQSQPAVGGSSFRAQEHLRLTFFRLLPQCLDNNALNWAGARQGNEELFH